MRNAHLYKILRRHGLVSLHLSNREIGHLRNLWGLNNERFLYMRCLAAYICDELPPEGIFVKELNTNFGGTLTIELGKVENEEG
ncbi:MAG: hypothetical protein M0R06_07480 [Sphaerochaeta sp.]|jgi:hypothetical protein|nr:hypothetical protein [Sphaerochaeta sp.]